MPIATDSDVGTGWAYPPLLQASFFLRACAAQAAGSEGLSLSEEDTLPSVPASTMASVLRGNMPEPRPTTALLLQAGAALQAVAEQQPLLPPLPGRVFGAPFSLPLAALPVPALLALVQACDLAGLPEPLLGLITASLAQRFAGLPRARLQAEVAAPSPRCAVLLQQWWRSQYQQPDFGPVIEGSLAAWRAAHPEALTASVRGRSDLTDADFASLRGIKALDMSTF